MTSLKSISKGGGIGAIAAAVAKERNGGCRRGQKHGSRSIWKGHYGNFLHGPGRLSETGVLPFVDSDENIVSAQCEDYENSDEVEKREEDNSSKKCVDGVRQRKGKRDLQQSNQGQEPRSGVNHHGEKCNHSRAQGQHHVQAKLSVKGQIHEVFVLSIIGALDMLFATSICPEMCMTRF